MSEEGNEMIKAVLDTVDRFASSEIAHDIRETDTYRLFGLCD